LSNSVAKGPAHWGQVKLPSILAVKMFSSGSVKFTIPSSDWLHDYKSTLGLGNYIGIEIPLPESKIDNQTETVQKLLCCYARTKEFYLECQWGDVVSETRKLLEHLRAPSVFELLCASGRYN